MIEIQLAYISVCPDGLVKFDYYQYRFRLFICHEHYFLFLHLLH